MPLIHFCWEEIGYSVFSASSLDPQKPERRCLPKRDVLVFGDEPRGGVQWMWICHPSCIGIGHHRSEASTSVAAPSPFVTSRSISQICSSWLVRSRTLHVLGFLEIQSLNLAFLQEVLDGLAVALGSSVKLVDVWHPAIHMPLDSGGPVSRKQRCVSFLGDDSKGSLRIDPVFAWIFLVEVSYMVKSGQHLRWDFFLQQKLLGFSHTMQLLQAPRVLEAYCATTWAKQWGNQHWEWWLLGDR